MSFSSIRESIRIPSVEKDVTLDVWFYKPVEMTAPFPLVVAGHGITVVKEAGLAAFGERWANDAGYASLIFDYRGFGKSGGEPRNVVSVKKQSEDYKSVVKWARQQPALFMNEKIVVMGSALSGLSVASLVIEDPGLAGGIAHSPMLDGYATVMSLGFKPRLLFWAIYDAIKTALGLSHVFVRAVSPANEFAFLNTPSSFEGFKMMFSQGDVSFSEYPNLINPSAVFDIMASRDGTKLKTAQCELLVVITENDDIMLPEIGRSIVASAAGKVILVEVPGGHFDVMKGGKSFEANINAQVSFLKRLLSR